MVKLYESCNMLTNNVELEICDTKIMLKVMY